MLREIFNLNELKDLKSWVQNYWRNAAGYYKLDKHFNVDALMKIANPVENASDINSEPGLYLLGSNSEQLLICQLSLPSGSKTISLKPSDNFELQPEERTIEEKAIHIVIYLVGPVLLILMFMTFPSTLIFKLAVALFFFFLFKAGIRSRRDRILKNIQSAYEFQRQKLRAEE